MKSRILALFVFAIFPLAGCKQSPPATPPQAMQAMPVQVAQVRMDSVPDGDTYVATIKGRRSATLQPQVDANVTKILVKSGDHVRAGQLLMTLDPLKQQATVQSSAGTEAQKLAVYKFNQIEVERQRKLFEAGVTSRDAYDTAVQAFENAKADYESSQGATKTQQEQLAYYQIRAPFEGIVGDIPVHVGDYAAATTTLTTVDEVTQLEAYIYIPTERASQVKMGLPVEILGPAGETLLKTSIDFLSPEVDNGMQSILAKASVPTGGNLRTQQIVKARVTWNSSPKPVVPVLAVTRINGQTFVTVAAPQKGGGYAAHEVAVTLGDAIGNNYPVLSGLNAGDRVIVSGLQFLGEGMPVQPLG